MTRHSWFERFHASRRLKFEKLEDRRVLATFTVTNLNDASVSGPGQAPGTLRQAIYDANASSDSDIIDFAPELSGDLRLSIAADSAVGLSAFLVTTPITIRGNAAGITIRRDVTAPEMRFFRVAATGNLTLESLNLTDGITRGAAGASGQNGGAAFAGAIYNQGTLQIVRSTLYDNTSIGGNAGSGGNSGAAQGGVIYNDGGNVSILNSTLSGNSVANGFGPLVARSYGGGVYSKNGIVNIDNSTITNNSATSGRHLYVIGLGPGQVAIANIRNSIIAQADVNVGAFDINATEDLGGQIIVTGSNNIIRSHNMFPSISVSSDDPQLAPLALNGGPTFTHALLIDSPAIDHGSNPLNLATDQRGDIYSRVIGGANDIGAFEAQTVVVPALLGDYNKNNFVDAGDYVVWRKTKGANTPQYTGADGNGNSIIDDADYGVWRGNFGASPPAAGTAEIAQISSDFVELLSIQSLSRSPQFVLFDTLTDSSSQNTPRLGPANLEKFLRRDKTERISHRLRDQAILAITGTSFRQTTATRPEPLAAWATETDEAFETFDASSSRGPVSLSSSILTPPRRQIHSSAAASIYTT